MSNEIPAMFYAFLFVFLCFSATGYCEYLVTSSNHSIGYLEYTFINVRKDDLYPIDAIVNASLNGAAGMLFHSISSYGERLTMSLLKDPSGEPMLLVKFRENEDNLSLRNLCGCSVCLYRPLIIAVAVIDVKMSIMCNGIITVVKRIYDPPIPDLPKLTNITIWSANTPNATFPQMDGCIFEIIYKFEHLQMNVKGNAIQRSCHPICVNDPCNGGRCYETYEMEPLCDCSNTFGSGRLCVDESKTINGKYKMPLPLFGSIKLSWQSNCSSIWSMGNNVSELALTERRGKLLLTQKKFEQNRTDEFYGEYTPNRNFIVILIFSRVLNIVMPGRGNETVPVVADFSKEAFSHLTFCSGSGVIDMAYKLRNEDIPWTRLQVAQPSSGNSSDGSTTKHHYTAVLSITTSVVFITIVLCVTVAALFLVWKSHKAIRLRKKRKISKGVALSRHSDPDLHSTLSEMWERVTETTQCTYNLENRNQRLGFVFASSADVIKD